MTLWHLSGDKDAEAFEKWARELDLNVEHSETDQMYLAPYTQQRWEAFRAGAQSARAPLSTEKPTHD